MPDITLVAEAGRPAGSRASRRLRADGRIPAVIYGEGVEAQPVSVAARDLRAALSTDAGLNVVLSLRVGSKQYVAMARELQRHPVRNNVTHVDFQVVDPDQVLAADVPLVIIGDPIEVHRADGVVDQQLFHLAVRARPADIPNQFELEVSELVIGGTLRVADIVMPAGVVTELDPETIVVHGQGGRGQTEGEAEGETAGAAEEGGASAEVSGNAR